MKKWIKLVGKQVVCVRTGIAYTVSPYQPKGRHDTFILRVELYGAWLLLSQSTNLMVNYVSLTRQVWSMTILEAAAFKAEADKPIYNVYMFTICT